MKELLEKHYSIVFSLVYLIVISFKESHSSFDSIVLVSLLIFSGYRIFLQNKGKITDVSLIDKQISEIKETHKKQMETFNHNQEELKKEVVELRSKLSILTTKSSVGSQGVRY